jgi:hypothetical protein
MTPEGALPLRSFIIELDVEQVPAFRNQSSTALRLIWIVRAEVHIIQAEHV